MIARIKRWWRRWLWKQVLGGAVRSHHKLDAEAMNFAFAVSQSETWFTAVAQVIGDHVADRVEIIRNAELSNHHGALAANAGAIDFAVELLEDLEARRKAASGMKEHPTK